MFSKAGLIGLFQSPKYREQISPVYMISDGDTSSLFIFVLFPGAYDDAYEVASQVIYQNIFIIPVSLEAMYVSDVFRLQSDLMRIKSNVKVLFDGRYPLHVPHAIENSVLRGRHDNTTAFVYQNGFIAFDWGIEKPIENPIYHRGFHDIYINFNNRRVLFCPHEVNKERILTMLENGDVDYVYVPYARAMFGDESYLTLVEDEAFNDYIDKFVAFGFMNSTEAKLCWDNHPEAFPVTIRWLFLNSYPYESDEADYVVIADRPWSPHYYPINMYPYPLERYDLGLTVEEPTDTEPTEETPDPSEGEDTGDSTEEPEIPSNGVDNNGEDNNGDTDEGTELPSESSDSNPTVTPNDTEETTPVEDKESSNNESTTNEDDEKKESVDADSKEDLEDANSSKGDEEKSDTE